MAPQISPTINPDGPVIRIPFNGSWLEPGLKITGPKKPRMKPIAPKMTPPIIICEAKLPDVVDILFHTRMLRAVAIKNEIIWGSK